jgi:putative transposase
MTGVSDKNSYAIGRYAYNKIENYLNKIDSINKNKKINNRNKKKLENKYRNKISYCINDMQWKTIKFLTDNFNNIIIGDLCAKSIVETNNIKKLSKRILHSFNIFSFQNRLEYKCKVKNVDYKKVNEYMTSKTCSICGNIKKDLKFNKIYECKKCNTILNRDVNGARCIYYVSLIK